MLFTKHCPWPFGKWCFVPPGNRLTPRYRIAILAYSDDVYDLLNGIKGIDEIAAIGSLPDLTPKRFSDSAKAFLQAEKILQSEIPNMQDCPAPLVCHMTDGVATERTRNRLPAVS